MLSYRSTIIWRIQVIAGLSLGLLLYFYPSLQQCFGIANVAPVCDSDTSKASSSDSNADKDEENRKLERDNYNKKELCQKSFYSALSDMAIADVIEYNFKKDLPRPIHKTMLQLAEKQELKKYASSDTEISHPNSFYEVYYQHYPCTFSYEPYRASDENNSIWLMVNSYKKYYLLMSGTEVDYIKNTCDDKFHHLISANDKYKNCPNSKVFIFFTNDSSFAKEAPKHLLDELDKFTLDKNRKPVQKPDYVWVLSCTEKVADNPLVIEDVCYDVCLNSCNFDISTTVTADPAFYRINTELPATAYDYEGSWWNNDNGDWGLVYIKAIDEKSFYFQTYVGGTGVGGAKYEATVNQDGTASHCFTSDRTFEKDNINFKIQNGKLIIKFEGDINLTTKAGIYGINNNIYTKREK
ncbi:MAG: hypothetical protein K6G50_07950 [bacterium]|nr:hypothetical protein [bacterium]